MEIIGEKENKLLKRIDVGILVDHSAKATPSRKELMPEVAKLLGSPEDTIIIDRIWTDRGSNKSALRVLKYAKKEDIPQIKLEKMEKRISGIKKEGAAASK